MNKEAKVCIIVMILIVLISICIYSFRNNNIKETIVDEVSNVVNEIEETEITNEVIEEEVANEVKNETVASTTSDGSKLSTQDFSASVYEDKTDTGTLSKKQEAIELVKAEWNKWGEDNTVTFSVDSITNDGIYIVAVTSKEKAEVLNYYRVNMTTKTVAVDY